MFTFRMGQIGWSGVLWLIFSMLGAFAACCGFFFPYWLKGSYQGATPVYMGTFRRCNFPRLDSQGKIELVMECGR